MEEMPNTTNLKEPRLKKLQKKISLFFYFEGANLGVSILIFNGLNRVSPTEAKTEVERGIKK